MAKFKLNLAQQEQFLQQIREGMMRGAAADVVFHADDPKRRRQVREFILETPAFEKAVEDAEVEATEHVLEALYQAAISGNPGAAKTWLELRGQGFKTKTAGALPKPPEEEEPPAPQQSDFGDLDNVEALDPRRRRGS